VTIEPGRPGGHRYRVLLSGTGPCGPIEEHIGRRRVRFVAADSVEGRRLLGSGDVDFVGPDGDPFGPVGLDGACARLRARLEARLGAASTPQERDALSDGLRNLEAWSRRCRET
jgi:uncharacterized membrane protein